MASKEADKKKILNSIALPRARTKTLLQEAQTTHESHLVGDMRLGQSLVKFETSFHVSLSFALLLCGTPTGFLKRQELKRSGARTFGFEPYAAVGCRRVS